MRSGDLAVLAAGQAGVHLFDVADFASPQVLGSWNGGGDVYGLALIPPLLYLADLDLGLLILDISDPSTPILLGQSPVPGSRNVAVFKGHAYMVRGKEGLKIIDVSNPSSPMPCGAISWTAGWIEFSVKDVVVSGDHAICSYTEIDVGTWESWGGVKVVDVSDPYHPVSGSSTVLDYDGCNGLALDGDMLYVAGYLGFYALDVSTLPSLSLLSDTPAKDLFHLALDGDRAYAGLYQMSIFDIADPANVTFQATLNMPSYPKGIAPRGDEVLAACSHTGLDWIRLPSLTETDLVAVMDLPGNHNYHGIRARGDWAYIAHGHPGLISVDISDPQAPVQADIIFLDGVTLDLDLWGDMAAVVVEEFGLVFVDISDPYSLAEISTLAIPGNVTDVVLAEDLAYCTSTELFQLHFHCVDLSQPGLPEIIGSLTIPAAYEAQSVTLDGSQAYLACHDDGLIVVDIGDPENPSLLHNVLHNKSIVSVEISDSKAYASCSSNGLIVLDLVEGSPPQFLDQIILPRYVEEARIDGHLLYMLGAGSLTLFYLNPSHSPILLGGGFRVGGALRFDLGDEVLCGTTFDELIIAPLQCQDATMVEELMPGSPDRLSAYPNPFNPHTTINLSLSRSQRIRLAIHDVQGRQLRILVAGYAVAGEHQFVWDGRDEEGRELSSGVYLSRLETETGLLGGKLILLR